MVMREEQLLSEAAMLNEGETRVRLVLAVSHTIPAVGDFSLFGGEFDEEENDLPAHRESAAMRQGVPRDATPGEELLVSEYGAGDPVIVGEDDPADVKNGSLCRMVEQLLEERTAQGGGEEPDKYIIRCDGVMTRRGGDIVISYREDSDDMGETGSEIVLHGGRRDLVSIVRTGAVSNTLVCEQGRRHISAYNTLIMPFQVCVFAKECSHDVSLTTGGSILLNYYVELRGTEMQHTKMRISVHVL